MQSGLATARAQAAMSSQLLKFDGSLSSPFRSITHLESSLKELVFGSQ
jgi:hypothetical protein